MQLYIICCEYPVDKWTHAVAPDTILCAPFSSTGPCYVSLVLPQQLPNYRDAPVKPIIHIIHIIHIMKTRRHNQAAKFATIPWKYTYVRFGFDFKTFHENQNQDECEMLFIERRDDISTKSLKGVQLASKEP